MINTIFFFRRPHRSIYTHIIEKKGRGELCEVIEETRFVIVVKFDLYLVNYVSLCYIWRSDRRFQGEHLTPLAFFGDFWIVSK